MLHLQELGFFFLKFPYGRMSVTIRCAAFVSFSVSRGSRPLHIIMVSYIFSNLPFLLLRLWDTKFSHMKYIQVMLQGLITIEATTLLAKI